MSNPTRIQYNGITLEENSNFKISNYSDPLPIRVSEDLLTGGDGGNIWAQKYGMRIINIQGTIWGDNIDDYFDKMADFRRAFTKNTDNNLIIRLWDNTERAIEAFVTDEGQYEEIIGQSEFMRFNVILHCPNVFYRDLVATIASTGTSVTGGTPVPSPVPSPLGSSGGRITINNIGDTAYYAKFTITGNVTNPTITNLTNGQSFTVNVDLSGGDVLELYRDNTGFYVLLNSSSIFSSFVGTFFLIEKGINTLVFTASSSDVTSNMAIEFYNRYLNKSS